MRTIDRKGLHLFLFFFKTGLIWKLMMAYMTLNITAAYK